MVHYALARFVVEGLSELLDVFGCHFSLDWEDIRSHALKCIVIIAFWN